MNSKERCAFNAGFKAGMKKAEDMQFIVCLCDSSDNVLCELERSGDGFYMIPKDAVDDIYLVNGDILKVKDVIR